MAKKRIEDAAQSNFHHPCPCSCLHLPLSGQRYTPSAMNANGCMDTAQKVAHVAQFQACSHFCLHLSKATVGLRKASTAGKNSSVGSARQPSLTQSKEVDLAAISYVRSAPPTIPLVWARSAVTAKVSFRFCSVKSSAPLASNASQRNERAM